LLQDNRYFEDYLSRKSGPDKQVVFFRKLNFCEKYTRVFHATPGFFVDPTGNICAASFLWNAQLFFNVRY